MEALDEMNKNWNSISAPVNFFYSAPSSPRVSLLPKHHHDDDGDDDDDDFEFDFSGQLGNMLLPSLSSADELFHAGIIRPLKPPPPPLNIESSTKSHPQLFDDDQSRGRSKKPNTNPRGTSRSLSPLRVSEFAHQNPESLKSGKKWRLKDFLLFRSASDGRAAITGSGKDPLRKYLMWKKKDDQGGSCSFRSTTVEGSVSRRKSAHELHYTANKAISEEMKKKTSLPYKHHPGLLRCLGFNPPAIQKLFGS